MPMPPSEKRARAEAGAVRRVAKDGPLIISIHVPKTAGSRFGEILKARYGDALAYYYGPNNPKTHPLARVRPKDLDADLFDRLHASGVRILHGHMRANLLMRSVPDHSRYWVWLREPIEQVISYYHFVRTSKGDGGPLYQAVQEQGISLDEFVTLPQITNVQTQYCGPLQLEKAGFVGVTEQFSRMLPLIGLRDQQRWSNVNAEKPMADRDTRTAIARQMTDDVGLYSYALELSIRRLGIRDTRLQSLYRRWQGLVGRPVAERIAAPARPLEPEEPR
ncbi:sulfotransferase family protein [Acuticoccus sp. M5D2P5]|uniref:sulfotransferase family protein n=1 Tax=Acuticoccus kalidii TaxID=2910977 RepID=UPI001F28D0A3|nr:sulfotransferase family protein [Acuticoccus kalidii]MCF3935757.1 sulfotransferase family protein [Acuticoccus kalidii]